MAALSRWRRIGIGVAITSLLILATGDRVAVGVAAGQQPVTAPPLRILVDDQANLALPDRLSLGAEAINNAGTWVNLAGSGTVMVLRPLGDPTLTRLLQTGDPVPGVTPSAIDLVNAVRINQNGLVCALVWMQRATTDMAILIRDGTTLRKVVASSDVAPSGSVFGRTLAVVGFNDAGDVGFTAPMTPLGWPTNLPVHTAAFIVRADGTLVRVVGQGDDAPGFPGATLDQVSGTQFNNNRELLFRAAIVGDPGGFGLFVARLNDDGTVALRKVVATGDSDLRGGHFDAALATNGVRLNDNGQVAMVMSGRGLYISSPGTGLALVFPSGAPLPNPLATTTQQSFATLQASFNDAGSVAFAVTASGLGSGPNAVLRYVPGPGLEVLAYSGQSAPGVSGRTFSTFSNLLMNDAGDVAFYSALAPSGAVSGGLFKSSGGSVGAVVLDEDTVPGSLGGTYRNPSYARLLEDGSVYFESNLQDSQATYAAFLARPVTPPGVQVIASDAEHVPPGSRIVFRDLFFGGGGAHMTFEARRAGSWLSLWTHDAAEGVTSKVAAVSDPAPPSVGGWLSGVAGVGNHGVMENGDVVFSGSVLGRTGTYLFLWSQPPGVSKLVGPGDTLTGTTLKFTSCSFAALLTEPFNQDSVVFRGNLDNGSNGIFLIPKAGGPNATIVLSTDTAPDGGVFTSGTATTLNYPYVNGQGKVAFWGLTSKGNSGIFMGAAGSAPVKVAMTGDAAPTPGGGTFSAFAQAGPAGFDDQGEVIFFATVTGGPNGLFAGKADGTVQAIALNGETAPAGGTYAFDGSSKDARTNARGDILFRAPLLSGVTAGSGLFLRRFDTHVIEPVAIQGQIASGTSFPLGPITQTINNYPGENYAVGPTGEALFYAPLDRGNWLGLGMFRYHGPGTLESVLIRGNAPPDGEGGAMVGITQGPGAGGEGLFFLRITSVDDYREQIYLLDTLPPVVTAAVRPAVLWPANNKTWMVTVSGTAVDNGGGAHLQRYFTVTDEYGRVQPSGGFAIAADGTFSFDVPLEARRLGTDFDGRQYVIHVTARDACGNSTTVNVSVVVPHHVGK